MKQKRVEEWIIFPPVFLNQQEIGGNPTWASHSERLHQPNRLAFQHLVSKASKGIVCVYRTRALTPIRRRPYEALQRGLPRYQRASILACPARRKKNWGG